MVPPETHRVIDAVWRNEGERAIVSGGDTRFPENVLLNPMPLTA